MSCTQQPQTLLLSENNTLKDLEEFGEIEPDLVKDYKLDAKKYTLISPAKVSNGVSNGVQPKNGNAPPARKLLLSPEDLNKARSRIEKWKIVVSTEMSGNVTRFLRIGSFSSTMFCVLVFQPVNQTALTNIPYHCCCRLSVNVKKEVELECMYCLVYSPGVLWMCSNCSVSVHTVQCE